MLETEIENRETATGPVPAGAAIAGLGVALPSTVKTNQPIADRLGVGPEWITERTGVIERRVASPSESLVDYAVAAGAAAIEEAGIDPARIDLVLVATVTHDMLCPAAAPLVAARLETGNAAAMDLNAACSGFLSGISMAAAQIETGRVEHALVVGADLMHRVIDMDDRGTAGIFADGGGAVVMSATAGRSRIGPVFLASDGDRGHLVEATRADAIIKMKGHDTFRQAVERLGEVTIAAADSVGLGLGQIDLFVYHQANSRILDAVGQRLGLPAERVVDCVPRYGNTSAGSIPIALAEARSEGRLSPGDKVLLGAFGGGLTWGAAVIEWGEGEDLHE
ncbi:MAG TPA: beta-ketoacyl-ACP synthase 3 [Solirubrobacterales bacterium]|nr:beta-ketoacyl-ACP synthase 3 [Solirubrobacterales bacterium]